jgi:hypothetical protein
MVCHYINILRGSFGVQLYFRAATYAQIGGFSNGNQRGFRTRDDAQAAWDHALANGTVGPPRSTISVGVPSVPLSPQSQGMLRPCSQTPQTPQLGSQFPMTHGSPVRASQQQINISPSLSVPRTMHGNQRLPTLPGTSVPHSPHPVISTRRITQYRLSDEDAYWVVVSGANLGVYHGR